MDFLRVMVLFFIKPLQRTIVCTHMQIDGV